VAACSDEGWQHAQTILMIFLSPSIGHGLAFNNPSIRELVLPFSIVKLGRCRVAKKSIARVRRSVAHLAR
jgi:hypothetical protein